MKKLFAVLLLILCLSFPVLAGHNLGGGWCECGTAGCICDPGESPTGRLTFEELQNKTQQEAPSSDLGSETLLIMAVLAMLLKFRA